jgi:hypothetical protein
MRLGSDTPAYENELNKAIAAMYPGEARVIVSTYADNTVSDLRVNTPTIVKVSELSSALRDALVRFLDGETKNAHNKTIVGEQHTSRHTRARRYAEIYIWAQHGDFNTQLPQANAPNAKCETRPW